MAKRKNARGKKSLDKLWPSRQESRATPASSEEASTVVTPMGSLISRLFRPVDIASLVVFRVCFGVIMAWEAYHYLYTGWVGAFWVVPKFNFTFLAFDWVRPWPGDGMYLHFLALGILALCIAAGCFYRLATILFFPGFAYVLLLDKTYYLNHFYLLTIISFLLILVPANQAFSIDAWRNQKIRSKTAPAWAVWALAVQIAIPYFYGGIAKLTPDWLFLGEPSRLFLVGAAQGPILSWLFTAEPVVYLFAWSGMLFDLFIPFLLWWPRTRTPAYVAVLIFHCTNAFFFRIGVFPWFMICASTLFFAPGWPRRFGFPPAWKNLRRRDGLPQVAKRRNAAPGGWASAAWGQKAAVLALAVHFMIQFVVPFHHFLYPGDAKWTREGGYFVWHMKLADLKGQGTFTVTEPATGRTWKPDLKRHLNVRQVQIMFSDPDMVLQYAHFLEREALANGLRDIEVRAKVQCSLNRRKPRLIIDPEADLTAHERTLWPASFIIPFEEAPVVGETDPTRATIDSARSTE
jgi:vitamin K-dependent gamma-carboxylase